MSLKWKYLKVGTIAWERICKNTERFGWQLSSAKEHEEITTREYVEGKEEDGKFIIEAEKRNGEVYIPTRTEKHSKRWVELWFYRDSSWFKNLYAISLLEIIYNIIFTIRKILGKLLPIATLLVIAGVVLFNQGEMFDELVMPFGVGVMFALQIWLIAIVFEEILARIAKAILKYK